MLPLAPSARSLSAALTLAGPPPSSKKSKWFCILSPFVSISVSIRMTRRQSPNRIALVNENIEAFGQ
jgi:hypothetical protein